jgi:hypothetical protein
MSHQAETPDALVLLVASFGQMHAVMGGENLDVLAQFAGACRKQLGGLAA